MPNTWNGRLNSDDNTACKRTILQETTGVTFTAEREKGQRALFPLKASEVGARSHPCSLIRHWTHASRGVRSTQPGRAPCPEPHLKPLLCSAWDQSPECDQGIQDLRGLAPNSHPASVSSGAASPCSQLPPECELLSTFSQVLQPPGLFQSCARVNLGEDVVR